MRGQRSGHALRRRLCPTVQFGWLQNSRRASEDGPLPMLVQVRGNRQQFAQFQLRIDVGRRQLLVSQPAFCRLLPEQS